MAIKDEVWVARLLSSPEKHDRDRKRYKIDPSRGDRISYRHLNRPRFTMFGKDIEFDIQTRDWMLRLMTQAKFLRNLLPGWHVKEKKFRLWYEDIVQGFTYFETPKDYEVYLTVLSLPDGVRGYREIRYPAMELAVKQAEALLAPLVAKKTVTFPAPKENAVPSEH
jgi:indolepyruvate ferredoxin oxidoreductase